MLRFLEASRCHLAVSLHSPFEEERRRLMPVQNVYPLAEVLRALRGQLPDGRRRVSFEYILFDQLNDTAAHARELARILRGLPCRINLIPFHPIPGSPLRPSPPERIQAFQDLLKGSGFITTLRKSRGRLRPAFHPGRQRRQQGRVLEELHPSGPAGPAAPPCPEDRSG